jgi:hypothetical protein
LVVTTQQATCVLCTEEAALRCSNCNQVVCNVHTSDYTQILGVAPGGNNTTVTTFQILKLCDTCHELHKIMDEEFQTRFTCICCLQTCAWLSMCATLLLAPVGYFWSQKLFKEHFVLKSERASTRCRELNARVSPPVPIKVSRVDAESKQEWTYCIYPHNNAAYTSTAPSAHNESAPLLPK